MNNSIRHLEHHNTSSSSRHMIRRKAMLTFAPVTMLFGLCGCGTNSTVKPQVAAVAFTDANGTGVTPVTALKVGQGVYLEATVSSDPQMLGVNWSVSCSSQLPAGTPLPPGQTVDVSCGYFTPVHTVSGPVPTYATSGTGVVTFYQAPTTQPKDGTVTLYAASTTDPSRFLSITLSILP